MLVSIGAVTAAPFILRFKMAPKTVCLLLRLSFTILVWKTCCCLSAQGQTCSCTGGCGNNGTALPGSDGRIENVAYGKLASMSSNFTKDGGSGPACAAVNGRTGTIWTPMNSPDINCVHTSSGDFDAQWQVDLGHNYTVADITIIRSKDAQRRMAGGSVYVDDQLCYSFPNSTNITALDALPEQIIITCTPPLTGQVVRFQKHRQDEDWNYYFINICEVQVWACKPGLYGEQCNQTCSGHCKDNDTCDNYYGTCPRGCEPGWTTPFCYQNCPEGVHGQNCSSVCPPCSDDEYCDQRNGVCLPKCPQGIDFSNPLCKQSTLLISVAGATGGVVFIIATVLIVCCILRYRRRSKQGSSSEDTVSPQTSNHQETRHADVSIEDNNYDTLDLTGDDGRSPYSEIVIVNRHTNRRTNNYTDVDWI
ncbi:uncharacterized protein [Littorina saxatilis]|uniref:uncharacterized protein isoform X1 n=1 Tax=Littorina saxatilis TaxID=31220 RepID=UPI0038B6A27E